MFLIRHEYDAEQVQPFCREQGVEFLRGMFAMKRYENDELTGWAIFRIEGQRVEVLEMCRCTAMDADLFVRSGINAARLRGCAEFSFGGDIWDRLSTELEPMGYTSGSRSIEDFLSSCGVK